ncbi:hypothetical protein [Sphingobium sp. YR768]|uniref:hypothetical protein n=1 Tax=Sphingobium sp. YR768 TaxID=1884365 RepID=UPI0008C93C40|nr:hypothetical protein [Sphingobium sp. YR768]SER22660.1 hypothetical protein SAMN05518866_1074 [Sphingobium sp. YR768]
MTIYLLLAIAYDVTLVAVCLYTIIRGGRPERWGAAINFTGSALSSVIRLLGLASWAPAEIAVLIIDLGVAMGFYHLAATTSRFWPIWAAGFALANLFASIAGTFLPDSTLLAYASGQGLYAYGALFVLAIGTARLPANADDITRSGVRPPCQARTNMTGSASELTFPDASSKP